MPIEYQALASLTLLFLFAWFPVSIGKWKSFGGTWLASNRDPLKGKELLPWAARCDRAYSNLKDYFPAYVVAVLVLGVTNKFDDSTNIASVLFVVARVGHYAAYALGNVLGRAIFFFIGLGANVYLLLKIFL
jgi:uncharacterized MAPEG superfamily protein